MNKNKGLYITHFSARIHTSFLLYNAITKSFFINTELANMFMKKGEYGQVTGETIITHKEMSNSLL